MATQMTPEMAYAQRQIQDLERRLAQAQAQVSQQQNSGSSDAVAAASNAQNALIDRFVQALEVQSVRLEALARAVSHPQIAGGEDVPGPRVPRFYTVNVTLSENSTGTASGEAVITNDGFFKCYGLTATYIATASTNNNIATGALNRFLPVSSLQLINSSGASQGTVGGATIGDVLYAATPDLSFQIQLAGTGRSWTPNVTDMPGANFYGVTGYNALATAALVPGGDRIVVTVKPERPMATSGAVRVTFQGYQVLTNLPVRY